MMKVDSLLVCDECDLLLREHALNDGDAAICTRCGNVLHRYQPQGLKRSLAFALTAGVLFVISNAFPIVALNSQGLESSTSLLGMVDMLFHEDMPSVACLVLVTTFIMPAMEICGLIYLLFPISRGYVPARLGVVFRAMHMSQPWAMVEVFMLGLLVTISKLHAMATVVPEVALWSFVFLMISLTAAAANFDSRTYWEQVESLR